MKRQQLIEQARKLGVSEQYFSSSTKKLIRAIQQAQGQNPCYLSDERYTCKGKCEWNQECKKLTAAWLR